MSTNKEINMSWINKDLQQFKLAKNIRLLSIHEHVINLIVSKDEQKEDIVMIASPKIYQGPRSIGIDELSFEILSRLFTYYNLAWCEFDEHKLSLTFKKHSQEVNLHLKKTPATEVISCSLLDNLASNSTVQNNLNNISRQAIHDSFKQSKDYVQQLAYLDSEIIVNEHLEPKNYFQRTIRANYPGFISAWLDNKQSEIIETASKLIGLGRGSTPTGDDMLHGGLLALHLQKCLNNREELINSFPLENTTPLGKHMIRQGFLGCTPFPVVNFAKSFLNNRKIEQALHQLDQIGSSTGYDIAIGFAYTLNLLVNNEQ